MQPQQSIQEREPGRWFWYMLFLSMPFYESLVAHIRPYELVTIIGLFYVLSRGVRDVGGVRALDVIVALYAAYQILAVAFSSEELYDAARYYRYLVLGPALTYMVMRMIPFTPRVLLRANLTLVVIVGAQAIYLLFYYLEHSRRAGGSVHPLITTGNTFAIYAAYCFAMLLYTGRHLKAGARWLFRLAGFPVLVVGLVVGSSRAVTFPFLTMLAVTPLIWRRAMLRRVLSWTIISAVIAVVIALAGTPPKLEYEEEELLEERADVDRVLSWDDYLMDGHARIQFWAYLFDQALESPLLGSGYANYDIADAGIGGHVAAAHNILISNVVTGGILSLALMLGLIFAGALLISRFNGRPNPLDFQSKTLIAIYPVFLISAITGDLIGGRAILFFFMLGLMQQLVIHAEKDARGAGR